VDNQETGGEVMSKELQVEVMAKHIAKLQAVVNAAKAVDISFQCSDDNGSYREIDADYLVALSKAIKELEDE
jgi:hypothetical protein